MQLWCCRSTPRKPATGNNSRIAPAHLQAQRVVLRHQPPRQAVHQLHPGGGWGSLFGENRPVAAAEHGMCQPGLPG